MARRTLLRSWLAASLLVLSGAAGVLLAPAPASAANQITVYVRDDGFSQTTINATVGDELIFRLDEAARDQHTLAWERGYLEYRFSRRFGRTLVRYRLEGPGGPLNFYDSSQLEGDGPHPPGPFSGTLTVRDASSSSSSSTTTSSTSTTTTTEPPASTTTTTVPPTTTTTTLPATTTTTAPTTIRPFLIPAPEPTTSTTATPNTTGTTKNPATGASTARKDKDQGKNKAASTGTPTTVAPVLPDEGIFDPESLTPGPTALPDGLGGPDSGDEAAVNAAAVVGLLDSGNPDGDRTRLVLIPLAALGLALFGIGMWRWHHRSSRYFPA